MNEDPFSRANSVQTLAELAVFLENLADSISEEPEIWENDTLRRFLKAWAAWTVDMGGYFAERGEPVPEEASWKLVAQMLLAARLYE